MLSKDTAAREAKKAFSFTLIPQTQMQHLVKIAHPALPCSQDIVQALLTCVVGIEGPMSYVACAAAFCRETHLRAAPAAAAGCSGGC